MQPVRQEVTQLQETGDLALRYPTIPLKHNISNWLEHSQIVNMALHADDSSVEDNTSSIGDSTWDLVDDGSGTTSDDEGHRLSRQHTPSTDGLELENESGMSVEGNNTSDESQGMESVHNVAAAFTEPRIPESREFRSTPSLVQEVEFEEDMEDTNQGLRPPSTQPQRETQPFKFQEPDFIPAGSQESFEVRHVLRSSQGGHGAPLYELPKSLDGIDTEVVGSVRMRMSNVRLHLKQPYKVFFAGPASVKELVMQKIGSALASSLEPKSAGSMDELTRFTVVPISSFGDGSSPEVLLVNSLGIDMNVEECMSASLVKEEAWKGTITLKLNGNKSAQSSRNRLNNPYAVSTKDYVLPDIAIICLTEDDQTPTKYTRLLARAFMIRHGVPVIMIFSEPELNEPTRSITLDLRTPHFCLEYRLSMGQGHPMLKRVPIDLATFLNIDSAQIGRNLMCISAIVDAPGVDKIGKRGTDSLMSIIASTLEDWFARLQAYTNLLLPQEVKRQFATRPLLYLLTNFLLLTSFVMATSYAFSSGSGWIPLRAPIPVHRGMDAAITSLSQIPSSLLSYAPIQTTIATTGSTGSENPTTKNIIPVAVENELISFLFDETHGSTLVPTNKSDKFTLHVIGDCHVVIRQPSWFTSGRRPPVLHFNVARNGEPLKYEFSTLFDGVHALKFAREDAYGVLDISVRTKKKPMVNETFQVDFGTPWLKLAGWKRAAQALTEQVREELQSAQIGLNTAYGQTSAGVQAFMRDAVKKAESVLKEVEKIGMTSLNQTSKTTEMMIAQSKELSRGLSLQFHKHHIKAPRLARRKAMSDVYSYTRRMSTLFTHQAQQLTEAATGLNVMALGQEFQQLRERHLRKSQKKALKMWWKVRGLPERKLAKAVRHERRKTRHQRSKVGGHR